MRDVLFVPYGSNRTPATRYRVTQYLGLLKERGIIYSVFSAISQFSTSLMVRSPDLGIVWKTFYYLYVYLERIIRALYIICISRQFKYIFLQRTTMPLGLEVILKALNQNIVFDIDDAIFMPDTQSDDIVTNLKKYIKEREVVNILRASRFVMVENEYIRSFVSRYCDNILKIPGPIDTDRFLPKEKEPSGEVVIGWIGSPATTPYLHMLDRVFEDISRKYKEVRFRFVGLGRYVSPDIRFEAIEWRYDTEVSELQSFDIGIMPMPDDEWTRGKLGCKMLQYMSVGIPAVVSYTPTNAEIVEDGVNGFFARDPAEWTAILSNLIENPSLRSEVGRRGRETIEKRCSLKANIDKYLAIFK